MTFLVKLVLSWLVSSLSTYFCKPYIVLLQFTQTLCWSLWALKYLAFSVLLKCFSLARRSMHDLIFSPELVFSFIICILDNRFICKVFVEENPAIVHQNVFLCASLQHPLPGAECKLWSLHPNPVNSVNILYEGFTNFIMLFYSHFYGAELIHSLRNWKAGPLGFKLSLYTRKNTFVMLISWSSLSAILDCFTHLFLQISNALSFSISVQKHLSYDCAKICFELQSTNYMYIIGPFLP